MVACLSQKLVRCTGFMNLHRQTSRTEGESEALLAGEGKFGWLMRLVRFGAVEHRKF